MQCTLFSSFYWREMEEENRSESRNTFFVEGIISISFSHDAAPYSSIFKRSLSFHSPLFDSSLTASHQPLSSISSSPFHALLHDRTNLSYINDNRGSLKGGQNFRDYSFSLSLIISFPEHQTTGRKEGLVQETDWSRFGIWCLLPLPWQRWSCSPFGCEIHCKSLRIKQRSVCHRCLRWSWNHNDPHQPSTLSSLILSIDQAAGILGIGFSHSWRIYRKAREKRECRQAMNTQHNTHTNTSITCRNYDSWRTKTQKAAET